MMQKSKRLTQIKEYVSKHKDIQISELASFIDASESTIRRDIKDLALEGFLEERYGSIVLREKNTTDVFLDDRLTQNVDQKNIAAKKAAALIE
ncbi:MAG: DeoR family transcriptional regulator, partial [Candidatus Izemoplasmatales bacterium]